MDYKFLGFHPMLKSALNQIAEQEEAFVNLRIICNDNDINKYQKLSTLQLNVMSRYLIKGYSTKESYNYSKIYFDRFKKISTQTSATQIEAEIICDMMDDKDYSSVICFIASRPYLWCIYMMIYLK